MDLAGIGRVLNLEDQNQVLRDELEADRTDRGIQSER